MRVPAYPIIASVMMLAAPAFAQTSTNPSAQPAATSTAAEATNGSTLTPDAQQMIRQSLEQSGLKKVRVVPESFLIHAQAPDGSPIDMMNVRVVPESFVFQAQAPDGSPIDMKNVRVVPGSFVLRGQAPDGSPIAMMLSPDIVTGVEQTGTSTQPQDSGQTAGSNGH